MDQNHSRFHLHGFVRPVVNWGLLMILLLSLFGRPMTPVQAHAEATGTISGAVRNESGMLLQGTASANRATGAGNTISGKVANLDGSRGIASARVDLYTDSSLSQWVTSTETGADGTYTFGNVSDGSYYLSVNACSDPTDQVNCYFMQRFYPNTPAFNQKTALAVSGGKTVANVNFTLDPAGLLSGTVTDNDQPVQDIPIVATDPLDQTTFEDWSDENGVYVIHVAAGRTYWLRTHLSANSSLADSDYVDQIYHDAVNEFEADVFAVGASALVDQKDFPLEKGYRLSGIVTDAQNHPLASALVLVMGVSDGRSYGSQPTDASGQYHFSALPGGSYKVRASLNGYQAAYSGGSGDYQSASSFSLSSAKSDVNVSLPVEPGHQADLLTTTIGSTIPDTFDPSLSGDVAQAYLLDQMFGGFSRIDPSSGSTIYDLADPNHPWTASNDATAWTFTLRSGLQWSDGSPLTTADVRFAILRSLRLDRWNAYTASLKKFIQGAEDYNAGVVSAQSVGITLDETDPNVIHFALTTPTSFFPTIMAMLSARPQPRMLVQAYPDHWLEPAHMLSSGPYRLVERDQDHVLLKLNPYAVDHHSGMIAQVIIRNLSKESAWSQYRDGALDMAMISPDRVGPIQTDPDYADELVNKPRQCTDVLLFNTAAIPAAYQPTDPLLLRKAMIEAIDRDAFNAALTHQPTAWTFLSEGILGHSGVDAGIHIPYNLAQAKADFAAAFAGKARAELPALKLYYLSQVSGKSAEMNYLANAWKQAFNTRFIPEGATLDQFNQVFDAGQMFLTPTRWCSDYQDGYNYLGFIQSKSGQLHWNNPTYNTDLETAVATPDETQRAGIYRAAEKILLQSDAIVMPLYSMTMPTMSRNFLRTFGVGGVDYIADWTYSRTDTTQITNHAPERSADRANAAGLTFAPAGEGGRVTYTIPNGVFPTGAELVHTGKLTDDLVELPAGLKKTSLYFNLSALNGGAPVSAAQPFTLTVEIPAFAVTNGQLMQNTLALYFWDAAQNQWVKDPNSRVDAASHRVTTQTTHLGDWLVMGTGWNSQVFLPVTVR